MKCIIIEDQAPAQQILQRYISRTEGLTLAMTFGDALEAKAYLNEHPVDLIFLDIQLPRLSGMDFLRSEKGHPLTILTTAYSEFALESYQFNVVDYLLKPFSPERFSQAIDKVKAITAAIKQMSGRDEHPPQQYVYIKSSHDLVKIRTDDIVFIKSDSDYTEVVTGSNKFVTTTALREWMEKLNEDFKQVHKSYIINTGYLRKISQNRIYLTHDQVIPLGRAFKSDFMEEVLRVAGL